MAASADQRIAQVAVPRGMIPLEAARGQMTGLAGELPTSC